MKQIWLVSLLAALMAVPSCSKETGNFGTPNITNEEQPMVDTISGWTLALAIDGSGHDKIILRHTQALRTMARTGSITDLRKEIGGKRNDILRTGHKSDINNIGFAPQLHVEHYIIAMYHPNNYPDHFIVYNINTKDWTRYEEGGSPTVYLTGNGN